ncbi:LPXTG cell wall anchor domain-containing protein [Microbacterium saccharophilum]|uniref:LPXTG cell wall anchor domain-containing protein n=1 Tax=Microbacterium saccharophilum TaxID=1213358 RepID=A0A5C8I9N1_9MICO|nr:LPXTG cell wall anchor domain-containing protein [Microbacterium saccharophilum]TXK15390.1 LPXTG cell wall anchor domain-containing protein [Microbacterium saccharophilum]
MKLRLPQAVATVALAAGLVFAPIAANATTYNPTVPSGSTVTIAPGAPVTITFTGFAPNELVRFFLTGENASGATLAAAKFVYQTNVPIGSKTATAAGAVAPTVTLPSNATGSYTLTATGATSTASATATITVAAASGGSTLPNTGGDSGQLLGLWIGGGALLLAGGGIAVATTVRRQRGQATA